MRSFLLFSCFLILFSCLNKDVQNHKPEEVKDYRTEISLLSTKLLENPNDTFLLNKRIDLFLMYENLEGALLDQQHLYKLDSNNYQYLSDLASTYFQLGEKGRASYYIKALNILNSDIVNLKSDISNLTIRYKLFYIFQRYKESIKDINTVLKQNKYLAEAYFYKGMNYKEIGDTAMAISQFQTVTEQDPQYSDAYEQLAFIYEAQNNNIAELYYDNALSLDSTNISLWYNKGMYLQNISRYDDAKKCYLTILRFDPRHLSNYNLGYIALLQEEYLDGANYFSEYIYNNNQVAMAYFARGLCFKSLKQTKKARFDFMKALDLDPSLKIAQDELSNIER